MNRMIKYRDESWDYRYEDTKQLTHCFHKYPAMMIPQVASRLIDEYLKLNPSCRVVLDPFCGTGTALLEAKRRSLESWGIDINPLARLISKTKVTILDSDLLQATHENIERKLIKIFSDPKEFAKRVSIPEFFNISYWFKQNIIECLSVMKSEIIKIKNKDILDFYKVVFSETVRGCSNVRSGEFKLFRIPQEKLTNYNPNVLAIFLQKFNQNLRGYFNYLKDLNEKGYAGVPVHILDEDTRHKTSIPDKIIDLVVTSPPYGDSKTTVAYGQFSRLSLQWLDFDDYICRCIDKRSLGGNSPKDDSALRLSKTLKETWTKVKKRDSKRASDLLSFYNDMCLCMKELDRTLKEKSRICFVVGNRTIKNVTIPTDEILVEIFERFGFELNEIIVRDIPNKTMPLKNSPTNIPGKAEKTMWNESIVIVDRG